MLCRMQTAMKRTTRSRPQTTSSSMGGVRAMPACWKFMVRLGVREGGNTINWGQLRRVEWNQLTEVCLCFFVLYNESHGSRDKVWSYLQWDHSCGGVESDLAVQRQETMKHVLGLHVLNWSRVLMVIEVQFGLGNETSIEYLWNWTLVLEWWD